MSQEADSTFIEEWPNDQVTYLGVNFDVANISLDDIHIEDIAHHLSNKCRFGGAVKSFYSVAQHSVYVSGLAKEHPLAGLLHDAAEAYIPDIVRPLQRYVNGLRKIEANLHRAIAEKFGTKFPYPEDVDWADGAILVDEARELIANGGKGWYFLHPEGTGIIKDIPTWTPRFAEMMFLNRFRALSGESKTT